MNLKEQLESCQKQLQAALQHHQQSEVTIHELNGQVKMLTWMVAEEEAEADKPDPSDY